MNLINVNDSIFEESTGQCLIINYNEYVSCIPLQGAAKVSILTIGQQAIVDAYLCLIHLTAGILVGKC